MSMTITDNVEYMYYASGDNAQLAAYFIHNGHTRSHVYSEQRNEDGLLSTKDEMIEKNKPLIKAWLNKILSEDKPLYVFGDTEVFVYGTKEFVNSLPLANKFEQL